MTAIPPQRVIDHWKRQGLSYAEIAARCERLGRAVEAARRKQPRRRGDFGPKGLGKRLDPVKLANLSKVYSDREIARMFGVSPAAIWYWRKKWNGAGVEVKT